MIQEKGLEVDVDRLYVKSASQCRAAHEAIRPAPMGRAFRYSAAFPHGDVAGGKGRAEQAGLATVVGEEETAARPDRSKKKLRRRRTAVSQKAAAR